MKVRLKFRNNFHVHEITTPDPTFINLLSGASNLFKIDLHNVQLSLNAKDYLGIDQSDIPLSSIGIVNGDIVYVHSLECLDDIRLSIETEVANAVNQLFQKFHLSQHSVLTLSAFPLYTAAVEKHLEYDGDFAQDLSGASSSVRMLFRYTTADNSQVKFTIYPAGNLLCLAVTSNHVPVARQLIILIREYFLIPAMSKQDSAQLSSSGVFKHLAPFCNRIKDELIEPLLVDIHTELGLPSRTMLFTLPFEVLTRIFMYLPLDSLGSLMCANSCLHRQIKTCCPLWRMHLARLNAKTQPLLTAALTRQQQCQQQQQQQQTAESPTGLAGSSPNPSQEKPSPSACSSGEAAPHHSEGSSSDDAGEDRAIQSYEHFITRYRSLRFQRKNLNRAHFV